MIEMDKKYYGYGFSTNMGYGSKKHREKLLCQDQHNYIVCHLIL